MRIGQGYDSHRFAEGRRLVLGGVEIPSDRGLAGHSDADAVAHAVTDAILGAAGLGDIGRHFPPSDPAWKDADSMELLARALLLIEAENYHVVNVDVTVVAERPRIAPHAAAMRAAIAAALEVDLSSISVKGKTNEGLDATGSGQAIAAHAVALLVRGDSASL